MKRRLEVLGEPVAQTERFQPRHDILVRTRRTVELSER